MSSVIKRFHVHQMVLWIWFQKNWTTQFVPVQVIMKSWSAPMMHFNNTPRRRSLETISYRKIERINGHRLIPRWPLLYLSFFVCLSLVKPTSIVNSEINYQPQLFSRVLPLAVPHRLKWLSSICTSNLSSPNPGLRLHDSVLWLLYDADKTVGNNDWKGNKSRR